MRRLALVHALFALATTAEAALFQGVEYEPPSGWTMFTEGGSLGFTPPGATPESGVVLVLGAAEELNQSFDSWFQRQLTEELADGSQVLQASEIHAEQHGDARTATIVRVVQETGGTTSVRIYHGVADGRKAALALAMAISDGAADAHSTSIRSFFASLRIQRSDGAGEPAASPPPFVTGGRTERVPESAVVDGMPRGIFLGRSLLTGRTVCLLFLGDGRITRAVPTQDLDAFDWQRHRADHPGDCGSWQLRPGQLSVRWGDGGVHEGPLKVGPSGIEFYGKTYVRPSVANLAALVGRWEAVRGLGIAGGAGARVILTLEIDAAGRFRWRAEGGSSGPHAAHREVKDLRGTLRIQGRRLILQGDDGTVEAHSFLAIPGDPLAAFALGPNMFTRIE